VATAPVKVKTADNKPTKLSVPFGFHGWGRLPRKPNVAVINREISYGLGRRPCQHTEWGVFLAGVNLGEGIGQSCGCVFGWGKSNKKSSD